MSGYNKSEAKVGRPTLKPGKDTVHTGVRYTVEEENKIQLMVSLLKAKGFQVTKSDVLREMVLFGLKGKAKIMAQLKCKVLYKKGA